MAGHRSLLLLLALSTLISTTWALGKASLAESAELDGSSESAVSAEPEVPGEEGGTVTKRPLTVTHRLQVELTMGASVAPRVTEDARETRTEGGGTNTAESAALKGHQNGASTLGSSKASENTVSAGGSVSAATSGTLPHNLRGAGFASVAGKESLTPGGTTDHCTKCPRATWFRHTGYTKGSAGSEPGALLPSSFCPRKPKQFLASEAIAALTAAGYGRAAKFLRESDILMSVNKPATLLVPTDEAFDSMDVPRVDQEPSLGALMSLHILEGMYSFEELLKSSDNVYSTLHPKGHLGAKVYQDGDFSSVTFRQTPQAPKVHPALVVKRDVFCNALVIVHVVNKVLEPQRGAVAQEGASHNSVALKEMAATVRDMDM